MRKSNTANNKNGATTAKPPPKKTPQKIKDEF